MQRNLILLNEEKVDLVIQENNIIDKILSYLQWELDEGHIFVDKKGFHEQSYFSSYREENILYIRDTRNNDMYKIEIKKVTESLPSHIIESLNS